MGQETVKGLLERVTGSRLHLWALPDRFLHPVMTELQRHGIAEVTQSCDLTTSWGKRNRNLPSPDEGGR